MNICPACQYPNDPSDHRCEKCGIRFELLQAATADGATAGTLGSATAWQGEVAQRVERFRERKVQQARLPLPIVEKAAPAARRRSLASASASGKLIQFPGPANEWDGLEEAAGQSESATLDSTAADAFLQGQFETGTPVYQQDGLTPGAEEKEAASPDQPAAGEARAQVAENVTPALVSEPGEALADLGPLQAQLNFPRETSRYDFPLDAEPLLSRPAAPLALRAKSAVLDGLLILLGWLVAGGVFVAMGGRLAPTKLPVAASLVGLALLAFLFFWLALIHFKQTPGMQWTGLVLETFDGQPPRWKRRLSRVLATVPSAGSFLLGFAWAAVDEEGLTWHDRMSMTCLRTVPVKPNHR